MKAWHHKRVEAVARALADGEPTEEDRRRADAAVHAADRAVGGVVPLEEYEQLALDLSAWKVQALETDDLLERALEALDRIAGGDDAAADMRGVALATAVEVRAVRDAQRDRVDEDEPA